MFEPQPKMFTVPATGEPYLYQHENVNAPASGTATGPTREARDTPDRAGAKYFAFVVDGPAGTAVELKLGAGAWVDGSTGVTVGTVGVEASLYYRVIAPALAAGTEESPVATIAIGCEHDEQPDYTAG